MKIEQVIGNIKKRIKTLVRWDKKGNLGTINDLKNLLPDLESTQQTQNELIEMLNDIIEDYKICHIRPCTEMEEKLLNKIYNLSEKINHGKK